jgi:hypothetical protein
MARTFKEGASSEMCRSFNSQQAVFGWVASGAAVGAKAVGNAAHVMGAAAINRPDLAVATACVGLACYGRYKMLRGANTRGDDENVAADGAPPAPEVPKAPTTAGSSGGSSPRSTAGPSPMPSRGSTSRHTSPLLGRVREASSRGGSAPQVRPRRR